MKPSLVAFILLIPIFAGCHGRYAGHDPDTELLSLQVVDKNGFSETISRSERLSSYEAVDFSAPQPYQKVLRVFAKKGDNKRLSCMTTYHESGQLWQYLEMMEGRAHGLYQEWYSNGQQKIEAFLLDGVAELSPLAQVSWIFDGESVVWNAQGELVARLYYAQGALDGHGYYYHPNGGLQKVLHYKKGVLEGVQTEFFSSGQLKSLQKYRSGDQEGCSRLFWESGALASEEIFRKGKLWEACYKNPEGSLLANVNQGNGFCLKMSLDGTISQKITIQGGVPEGVVEEFFQNQLCRRYQIQEGEKEGEEVEFYLNEKQSPKLSLSWVHGDLVGIVKTWYPSGIQESQKTMFHTQKNGVCCAWYEDGSLMFIEEYEKDRLLSGCYFKPQDKQKVSSVEAGNGTATLYSAKGAFCQRIFYENGVPQP